MGTRNKTNSPPPYCAVEEVGSHHPHPRNLSSLNSASELYTQNGPDLLFLDILQEFVQRAGHMLIMTIEITVFPTIINGLTFIGKQKHTPYKASPPGALGPGQACDLGIHTRPGLRRTLHWK